MRLMPRHRRHEKDATPCALLPHHAGRLLREEETSLEICFHNCLEIADGVFKEITEQGNSGIGNCNVYRAKLLHSLANQRPDENRIAGISCCRYTYASF